MYAIVEIAGQQFKVEPGKKIFVHRLDAEEGKEIKFDHVLLVEDGGMISVGEPGVKDAIVEGKVLEHLRGEKVIVFKKKRKKGYRIKNGHRQNLTQVEIISINGKGVEKRQPARKEKAKVSEPAVVEEPAKVKKTTAKKAAVLTEKQAETKGKKAATKEKKAEPKEKPASKKSAVKKPAEKKPAVKKAPRAKK